MVNFLKDFYNRISVLELIPDDFPVRISDYEKITVPAKFKDGKVSFTNIHGKIMPQDKAVNIHIKHPDLGELIIGPAKDGSYFAYISKGGGAIVYGHGWVLES